MENQKSKKLKITYSDAVKALNHHKLLIHSPEQISKGRGRIMTDSRLIKQGDIYIALRGSKHDGHDHINEALKKGCSLLIVDKDFSASNQSGQILTTTCTRHAWSTLCAAATGHPEEKLRFLGVTGTNGKTTSTFMAYSLSKKVSLKTMLIGTLGCFFDNTHIKLNHTTPDPDVLFPLLQKAVQLNIKTVLMEVSSHSLIQNKLSGIRFYAAVFTNLSQDHLDFHHTMENYLAAKLTLFQKYMLPTGKALIHSSLRKDIEAAQLPIPVAFYGPEAPADYTYSYTEAEQSMIMELKGPNKTTTHKLPFLGAHNAENFCAAHWLIALFRKNPLQKAKTGLLKQVPGRQQFLPKQENNPTVIVDFAHTPDALKEVLSFLKTKCSGSLWVVFGCGGDRDSSKRPIMGQIATSLADHTIITDDNPRSEPSEKIISQVLGGCNQNANYQAITNREQAIHYSITHAKPQDWVVIAGKGHEENQIIGKTLIPFNDAQIATKIMKEQA